MAMSPQRAVGQVSRLLAVLLIALLIVHLAFPSLAIDPTFLGLLVLLILVLMLPYSKAIHFPGGGGIEFVLHDAERAVKVAEAQPRKEPRRIVTSGEIRPTGDLTLRTIRAEENRIWQEYVTRDPNVALAGLRIEIERLLRTLSHLVGGVEIPRLSSIRQVLDLLRNKEVLTPAEAEAVDQVVQVCNRAVHAEVVTIETAQATADLGERVLALLRSKLPPPSDR